MPVTRTPPKTSGAASTAEAEAAAAATEEAVHTNSFFEWPLEVNGETYTIQVDAVQDRHLKSRLTKEEQDEYLRWIFDDQVAAAAKAEATAAAIAAEENPEDLRSNSPSPTPTVKSLDTNGTIDQIRNRTNIIDGSLRNNSDVKNLFEDQPPEVNNNEQKNEEQPEVVRKLDCKDRHHLFEHRCKTHLSAPGKKFKKAVVALKFQLNRGKFSDEVSIQFGDDLLNDVVENYEKVETAREYCLEVLEEEERVQYEPYLEKRYEELCECKRIHRQYFEKVLEDKIARSQQQMSQPPMSQVQTPFIGSFLSQPPPGAHIVPNIITTTAANILPPMMTSTPFHQNAIPPLGPQFDQMFGQNHHHTHGPPPDHHSHRQQSPPPTAHGNQQQQPQDHAHGQNYEHFQQKPPSGGHPDPMFGQTHGQHQEQFYGQSGPDFNNNHPPPGFETKAPPGFKILDEDRIPTPSAPSVIETRHHTRFKLRDELSLVEKFDATEPSKYMAFRAQWNNFVNKMKSEQRSNLDLYYSLLKVLDGRAKDFVSTKYPSDQSYAQAIAKLDEHFYNPTIQLRDMIRNLLKGQKMSDTYDSLLSGITKLNDAWNDLKEANLTKNQLQGLLFIAATEKNLSNESWSCWLNEQNDPKYQQNPMAAFEISTYLKAITQAMLNAQKRKNVLSGPQDTNSETPPKTGRQNRKQSTLYGAYSNSMRNHPPKVMTQQQAHGPNNTCVICGQRMHKYQLYCPRLKELRPKEIYNLMQQHHIECQMCLGLGHRTKQCPAVLEGFLKKCSVKENDIECGRYHCRVLHRRAAEESKDSAPPKQE